MAKYELFFPLIVADERLIITDDPNDKGGYSVAGISSVNYPHEPAILKAKELGLKHGEWDDSLLPLVMDFYKRKEWDVYRGDEIINQEIINTIANRGVNIGVKPSIKMAQKVCEIEETGVMDDATVAKINELNPYA